MKIRKKKKKRVKIVFLIFLPLKREIAVTLCLLKITSKKLLNQLSRNCLPYQGGNLSF